MRSVIRVFGSVRIGSRILPRLSGHRVYSSVAPQSKEANPMDLVNSIPPIEVDGDVAICDGGDNVALGHPREYIQLNKRKPGTPETCKYCGLRYVQKVHH